MMASEILTSMGSTTDSILNGPAKRSASFNKASENTKIKVFYSTNDKVPENLHSLGNTIHSVQKKFKFSFKRGNIN